MGNTEELGLDWLLKKVKLAELYIIEDPLREYSISSLKKIKESIKKFGLIEPLVINTDGEILDGNLRYRAMTELGFKECLVTYPERKLTGEEVIEAYIRKNKNIAGVFDNQKLSKHFTVDELKDGGFSDDEIESIKLEERDITIIENNIYFTSDIIFETKELKDEAIGLIGDLKEKYKEEKFENIIMEFIKKEKK